MNRKFYCFWVVIFTLFFLLGTQQLNGDFSQERPNEFVNSQQNLESYTQNLYQSINGQAYDLNYDAFHYAIIGYASMLSYNALQNDKVLTIIDFTKTSKEKRFYTIDLEEKKIIHYTLVSHGEKSGGNICTKFSDRPESHQSSIGFYTTGRTYFGKHGLSLRLHGNEKGYNANAYKRAVVIHSADYVSESYIKNNGRLGRSYGCPALPPKLSKRIIQDIKGGSLVFAYYNDTRYLNSSRFLKNVKPRLLAKICKVPYSMNVSNS